MMNDKKHEEYPFSFLREQIKIAEDNHLDNLDDLVYAISIVIQDVRMRAYAEGLKEALRIIEG